MRTSRISQETTRIFNAISPNKVRARTTRSRGKGIATFSLDNDGTPTIKQEDTLTSTPSSPLSLAQDVEDIGVDTRSQTENRPQPNLKRKRNAAQSTSKSKSRSANTTTTITKTEQTETYTSPRKRRRAIKADPSPSPSASQDRYPGDSDADTSPTTSPRKSYPKLPAKRKLDPSTDKYIYTPPSNWETIYSSILAFRKANPTAPVDTMGCEDLFWQTAPPATQRYHTLTALMLSSQTKDTVTAAAMQKLHTSLIDDPPLDPTTGKLLTSSLTISNILAATPERLNSCIRQVGFHNNKTRFIKAVAEILHTQYNDDIPDTIEGLVSLPGVGPKMAYLCLSAAWKRTEGIGVDVHVHRITNLWGWHKTNTPEQTREWLEGWLPREKWHEINKMLVGLGQMVCLPIGRRCGECVLFGKGLCKGEVRGWVKKEESKRKRVKIEVKVEDEQGGEVARDEKIVEDKVVVKKEIELEEGRDGDVLPSIEVKEEEEIDVDKAVLKR